MAEIPDSEYIRRSLEEAEAFAVLFDRYSALLYRYAVRRLGPAKLKSSALIIKRGIVDKIGEKPE